MVRIARARRAPACPLASLVPAPACRCTYLVYTCDRVRATTTGDTHRGCVSPVRAAPPRVRLPHSCPPARVAARISYTRVIVCAPPRRATHTVGAYRPCPPRPRVSACLTRARPRAHITRTHAPRSCGAPQRTLLHYALHWGCLDAAGMLLEAGADPSVTDKVRAAWRSARVARGLRVRAGSRRSCMRGAARRHATFVVPEEWKDGVRGVVCESQPRAGASQL